MCGHPKPPACGQLWVRPTACPLGETARRPRAGLQVLLWFFSVGRFERCACYTWLHVTLEHRGTICLATACGLLRKALCGRAKRVDTNRSCSPFIFPLTIEAYVMGWCCLLLSTRKYVMGRWAGQTYRNSGCSLVVRGRRTGRKLLT